MNFFQLKEFTTYVHIFQMHVGDIIRRFGGIQKLGNFSIESHHQLNKLEFQEKTNHKGNCAYQALCAITI